MSVHKECGADIQWAKRSDDDSRWLPPLEYVGEVFMIDSSGAAVQIHGYRRHDCDPDAIIAWQDYQQRLAEAKGEVFTPYQAARERDKELVWEIALKVVCPRCDAKKKEKCRSMQLTHRRTGEVVYITNPHPARLGLAEEKGLM